MTRTLELDGTDGGGQLVRTALTLSALDTRPFRMENVRGNRPNPGLKRQHLACVDLLTEIVDAEVSGDDVGSETLEFAPDALGERTPRATDLEVDVGTAGSVTLVADTLLPLAVRLDAPISARLVGGTDVKWSPPADYLRHVKLPLLAACGLDATVDVERRGFYPAGSGELAVEIRPSTLSPIELPSIERSESSVEVSDSTVYAVASEALEDADVADRIAEAAVEGVADRGIDPDASATTAYVETDSPGAVVTIAVDTEAVDSVRDDREAADSSGRRRPRPRAGFAAYGERGVPSEAVAADAVDALARWSETGAPVDAHLGDQLVVWLALGGGTVRIPRVTDHVRTNVDLVRTFGYEMSIDDGPDESTAILSAPTPSS